MGDKPKKSDLKTKKKSVGFLGKVSPLLGSALGVAVFNDLYAKSILKTNLDSTNSSLVSDLLRNAAKDDIKVVLDERIPAPHFNNLSHTVFVRPDEYPWVLAHELGHAKLAKNSLSHLLLSLYNPVWTLGPLMSASTISFGDADNAKKRRMALLGSLWAAPLVLNEIAASTVGLKYLKGAPFRVKAKSFAGVPTYLAIAMLPWIAYAIRTKIIDKKRREKQLFDSQR